MLMMTLFVHSRQRWPAQPAHLYCDPNPSFPPQVLNRNPDNVFAENEQVAFCPAIIVPGAGIEPATSDLLVCVPASLAPACALLH